MSGFKVRRRGQPLHQQLNIRILTIKMNSIAPNSRHEISLFPSNLKGLTGGSYSFQWRCLAPSSSRLQSVLLAWERLRQSSPPGAEMPH
jgi:hypothetical protein